MADYSDTGVFNIDGQWATSINYEVKVTPGGVTTVDLQFKNNRAKVAAAELTPDQARELLGAENYGGIDAAIKEGKGTAVGQLRGRQLRFRQVTLPTFEHDREENAISLDSRAARRDEKLQRGAAQSNPPVVEGRTGEGPAPQKAVRKDQALAVPDDVARKFVHVGDNYYFHDKTIAFTDKGTKIKAESTNLEVVRSLVKIAEARGWESISVTGTDEFRRQVWHEASTRGLSVRGYRPTDIEREQMTQRKARHEAEPAREPSATPAGAARVDELTGKLVAVGNAPYQFKAGNKASYYATVETAEGQRTAWGSDLKRAFSESKSSAAIGDQVTIRQTGAQSITINGEGNEKKQVTKNLWSIERSEWQQAQTTKADAVRTSQAQDAASTAREHPELSGALAAVFLQSRFAQEKGMSEADAKRMAAMVKERFAASIERGEDINLKRLERELAQKLPTAPSTTPQRQEREAAHAR